MANRNIARAVQTVLFSAAAVGAGLQSAPVAAQEQLQEIVVTGSRIVRRDFTSNSPITTFPAEQVVRNADITLDTFLNSLPQVSPAGTTTSNNPGNGGQSNVDLGLGANRNLVLLDGRRAMPSGSDLTVDINTIPQAMIESIEIVGGGASAVYGADAVAGAVNFKLKSNFEGIDIRAGLSNSTEEWDAQEWTLSAVIGGNFADGRGNAVFGFDYANREGMIKSQRPFAAQATSTTSFLPEGNYIPGSNGPSQAVLDTIFAGYVSGYVPGDARTTTLGFNLDGTLYSRGVFNSPLDVVNFRYPIDLAVATKYFPDFHSYNFDAVNILTLPLERRSFMTKMDYQFEGGVEVFGRVGWTEYNSAAALAPTPFPTVTTAAPGLNTSTQAQSSLVVPGKTVSNALIVPVTNPWIPADFATLLASRTGDNPSLVGSGATEPFTMRQRSISAGLRQSNYENTVVQYMVGAKGPIMGDNWRWELSYSEGFTEIDQVQSGNLDTNRLLELAAAADGGVSKCGPTGFNLFGRHPLSPQCVAYIELKTRMSTEFSQKVAEGFITGDLVDMPAGPLAVVLGVQGRYFQYDFSGTGTAPISGFNAQTPSRGKNSFEDIFGEALIPILKDAPGAQSLELNLGYRLSNAKFEDQIAEISNPTDSSNAYFASLSWEPLDYLRVRGGYQRAVRAPNFSELFDGGGSAPQYFDPCSVTTNARTGSDAAAIRQLCRTAGGNGGLSAANIDIYVQTPGNQISISTAGNTALQPEEADTYSIGLVFSSPWGGAFENLQASLDYSKIKIKGPILAPSPNVIVASCYNYYGTNPTFDPNHPDCVPIIRFGGDIIFLSNPLDPTGTGLYPGVNGGGIKGDGLDLQVNWALPVGPGDLRLNLLWVHSLSAKAQDAVGLPWLDYSGTVTFFGAGLGSSSPEDKINLSAVYTIGDFAFDSRLRFISAMDNRASVIFPGETSFTGVPSVTYMDVGASYRLGFFGKDSQVRIGVNNVTDKQPPEYAPNVQSGTESSLYDIIGRRIFGQIIVKF